MKRPFTLESDFKCTKCDRYFASKQRLHSHIKSPYACARQKLPDGPLTCPCGETWSEKTAKNVQCWREHVRTYAKRNYCLGYIPCRHCRHNIQFQCRDRNKHVCDECVHFEHKLSSEGGYHPILTEPFGSQSYQMTMERFPRRIPHTDRELTITDERYRAFQYFHPTAASEQPATHLNAPVAHPDLQRFQATCVRFCVHSAIWQAIVKHSNRCLKDKYSKYTQNTNMLKSNADLLYWLYLSPQAHIIRIPPLTFDPVPDVLLRMDEYALYSQNPILLQAEFMKLSTDDHWRGSPRWNLLSLFFGRPSRAMHSRIQAFIDHYSKNKSVCLPFGRRTYPNNSGIIHPILSQTGPIRVCRMVSRWHGHDDVDAERAAEELFYFIMQFVAHHDSVQRQPKTIRDLIRSLS